MKLDNSVQFSKPQFMIIPMIDIIFFLLVFFMVSSISMIHQKTMPVNLPVASAAETQVTEGISVSILEDGKIFLEDQEVTLPELKSLLETKDKSQLEVTINGDQQIRYSKFVNVLDALSAAGIQNISIAVEKVKDNEL